MSVEKEVRVTAEDKAQGMTLAEVAAFVQEAMRLDIPPDVRIKSTNGWRSQLQALRTER